jgi:hypothetical protein
LCCSYIGTLRMVVDDGAVVWLNGFELMRVNLPLEGAVAPNTLALLRVDGDAELVQQSATIEGSMLLTGTNVIAVEVCADAAPSRRRARQCLIALCCRGLACVLAGASVRQWCRAVRPALRPHALCGHRAVADAAAVHHPLHIAVAVPPYDRGA